MEWTIEFDEARGVAIVTTRGVFNDVDNARMVAEIVSHPKWIPGHRILFDHRMMDFGNAGYQQMLRAGGTHRAHDDRIGNARSALLMKSMADYGVGRQFEHMVDDVRAELGVFIDEDAAWRWLLAG